MAVLCERLTWDEASMIVEGGGTDDSGKPKSLYMKGVFIEGNVQNANGRVYPAYEIGKAVNQLQEAMQRGETIYGEADHPEELQINIDRVSHIITEIELKGTNGMGKLKILPTPLGNICRTLIDCGGKLGVSSRGSGNVGNGGQVSEFEIITVDIVARPSAPNAYPDPIYESLFGRRSALGAKRQNGLYGLAEAVTYDKKAQTYLKKELLNFMDELFEGKA